MEKLLPFHAKIHTVIIIGNISAGSSGHMKRTAVQCVHRIRQKIAVDLLSTTAAADAAAKTWFHKLLIDYMQVEAQLKCPGAG